MGIFSSKTKVAVSSVVYNMAGDFVDRPDYLKSLVAQHMATPDRARGSLGDTLQKGYLHGPMMNRRAFYNWCKSKHPEYLMGGTLQNSKELPRLKLSLLSYIVKEDPAAVIQIQGYSVERADFFYWAENYVAQTYPGRITEDWTCDINATNTKVFLSFPGGPNTSFTLAGFNPAATYLYVQYDEVVYNGLGEVATRTPYIWTYQMGSGTYPVLEKLLRQSTPEGEFFPVVPLRQNNVSIRDLPEYSDVAEIYKKLSGRKKLDALLDSIEENESIDDIDYAAVVFGVCANDETFAAKRYMYEFFRKLISYQETGIREFLLWKTKADDAAVVIGGEPVRYPAVSSFAMKGAGAFNSNYEFVLSWACIDETLHTGLGKVGAKKNDIWFEVGTSIQFDYRAHASVTLPGEEITVVDLFWQTSATSYKKLRIYGMRHQNFVYGGKDVITDLADGVADADESAFIVPLHMPTLKRLPLIQSSQLCTTSTLLVFNCYTTYKVRWYQRGIFKILLVVLSIAASVLINPGALGAATGLLGTNLAVGTALGLSGLSAIILGAVTNALAAMILVSMVQEVSVSLFGEKFGALIGAIASFLAVNLVSSWATTGSFDFGWNKLMMPENLLKMTEAGANAFVQWAQGEIQGIQGQMDTLTDEYNKDSAEIEDLYASVLGYSGVSYDPLMFAGVMDSSNQQGFSESNGTFLYRTLLVGSEIAEISHTMISDFAQLSLKLPEAIT